MRKSVKISVLMVAFLCFANKGQSQTAQAFEDIGHLLNDAIFFSNQYITPATDAAVYQAASGWMTSPKKTKTLGCDFRVTFQCFFCSET
jgi:hypothetical protein